MIDFYSPTFQKSCRSSGKYDEVLGALKKCPFCDLKDKYIISEKDDVVLSANLFPYVDGHLIIIPRRHLEQLDQLSEKEWSAVKILTEKAIRLLKEKMKVNDLQFVYREGDKAGKSLKHLHFNLIPYDEDLIKWQYQAIKISPLELAKLLKNGAKDSPFKSSVRKSRVYKEDRKTANLVH